MVNSHLDQECIQKLTKTILIGLPAVGKSTLSDELSRLAKQETGFKIEAVSSDLKFRAVRKDKNHPIVQKFMKEYHIPDEDFPLLTKTNDFVKKYGESVFRDLESAVILDMLANGEFDGKIPNLGGKAMLHPRTAEAFKKRGYQVIYLKTDLKTIVRHITKDFEAMLDGATITRSPINGPIMEDLKKKCPSIAEQSPQAYELERIAELKALCMRGKKPLSNVQRAILRHRKMAYQYVRRLEARNAKALEVITKRYNDGHPLYESVADRSVFLSGEMKKDIALLCRTIGIKDLSQNAKTNDIYTNSIRSIIPGIDEVVPYTYDDDRYSFQECFDPIIEQFLKGAPSSDNPKLIHMLGIPGAGKTTFYQEHKDEFKDYVLIGFDLVMEKVPEYRQDREKLGKMEAFNKWEIPARIAGYELLRRAIEQKKNIFFDHGGTPICHRELLSSIKKMGYETTVYYVDCEPERAIDRIAKRERPFPKDRMNGRVVSVYNQKSVMSQIADHFFEINNNGR